MSILRLAVNQAQEKLRQFADSSGFMDKLELAFGRGMKRLVAQQLQSAWRQGDFSVIPAIELLPAAVLSPAVGAYASSTDRIYLSQSFLAQPVNNLSLVVDVLLEEIGHRIDCLINVVETPGDEGAIFAGLVQGRSFTEAALHQLRAEDDWGVVELEGQRLAVERAVINGTSNSESLLGTELDDSILGLAGNDSLFGNGGNDLLLDGGDGNDRIDGGDGSDLLYGQLGNDTLIGGLGDDQLYDGQAGIDSIVGGAGIDYLRLDDSNANGNLTVTYTSATNGSITGGNKDGTTFKEIEAIYFIGCTGNDTITLTAATSSAYGYAVEVLGGAGDDFITSGIGVDALRGEVGNDTLTADAGADALYGGEGSDRLDGGADNDYLLGSNDFTNQMVGNDTLMGGDGDDGLYDGGAGVDSLDGGTGIDYLSLTNAAETANTTVTYTTASSGSISGGSKSGTSFRNIEKIAYVSGSGHDTIDVSAAANSAYVYYPYGRGYYYAADISGGDGNDTMTTGLGNDYLSGGGGNDRLTAGAGVDDLYGGTGDDRLEGEADGDYIYGDAGKDTLLGGEGDDSLFESGAGADSIDGGTGNDFLSISNSTETAHTTVTFTTATSGSISGGGKGGTTFSGVESFSYSSGSGNDIITLTAGSSNYLSGGAGNDSITSGSGSDLLLGGEGDDILVGGSGTDTALYGSGNNTVNLSLTTPQATGEGSDVLSSIENLRGGNGNDSLTGNGNANQLDGESGNDTLIGGAVNDSLFGGSGTDTAVFGSGNNTVNLSLTTAQYTGEGPDVLTSIENLVGGSGNDRLIGSVGQNSLNGGDGNDTLIGSSGKDALTGGSGADTFTYSSFSDSFETGSGSHDDITDYNYASGDRIDAPTSVIAATLIASVGNAASLSAGAISAVLTTAVFTANSAKAFTVTGTNGTFLALNNDTIAGFNAANDAIIHLDGFTIGAANPVAII